MITQITNNIKISVLTNFEGTLFKNKVRHFAFTYQITIENHGTDTVQLISRHWDILDSLNYNEMVDGEGVIGQKPIIEPGESHSYTSGCLLCSTLGAMNGHYNMINLNSNQNFKVGVPTFQLSTPYVFN